MCILKVNGIFVLSSTHSRSVPKNKVSAVIGCANAFVPRSGYVLIDILLEWGDALDGHTLAVLFQYTVCVCSGLCESEESPVLHLIYRSITLVCGIHLLILPFLYSDLCTSGGP